MSARGPIIYIALDACDHEIARGLAMAGELPALRRLFDRAARCRVQNPFGLYVGALWMSFATALRRIAIISIAGTRSRSRPIGGD